MKGRHEIKHAITWADYQLLHSRLRFLLKPDPHADSNGTYHIRSLYFDSPEDTALREKLDGVRDRDKYRIRYYNRDPDLILLERKSKRKDLCIKASHKLSQEQVEQLLSGNIDWLKQESDELMLDFYQALMHDRLRPKTIVDYLREPYIYSAGNVRVTLDHQIRTGLSHTDFLNPQSITIPVPENPVILEVKWDSFLPELVRQAVSLENARACAFSKYAAARAYD